MCARTAQALPVKVWSIIVISVVAGSLAATREPSTEIILISEALVALLVICRGISRHCGTHYCKHSAESSTYLGLPVKLSVHGLTGLSESVSPATSSSKVDWDLC